LLTLPESYVTDGNAHFFTAVEAIRRGLAVATSKDAIVVAIGYPDTGHYVFGDRRAYDLTPPVRHYVPPTSWDGREFAMPHGGADKLLELIQGSVRHWLLTDMFPHFVPEREVLVGHSYGSLFALHALFRNDTCFDTYVALSPTIWWSDHFLLGEEKAFQERNDHKKSLSLYLSYGHYEQYPKRRKIYSDDEFAKRQAHALSWRTKGDADEMADRLRASSRFSTVKVKEYMDEDHGSLAGCALGWAICDILDPDRFI
jgi:predicted alpha/beta superfamily hydrolase